MSNPGQCQHDAGILDNGKLTDLAKDLFIKDVKDLIVKGDAGVTSLINFGPPILPSPGGDKILLEDKGLFPDFHDTWLGTYEEMANMLDLKGQFMFAPIVQDPVALASKLGLDVPNLSFPDEFLVYGLALPLLAVKLGFTLPIELVGKLPSIIVPAPPIPDISAIFPPDFDPQSFPALIIHKSWPAKIPGLFAELIVSIPSLLPGLLTFNFGAIGELIFKSGIFGKIDPTAVIQVAATKVLTRKMVECILFAIIGSSVGSSAGGIVGGISQILGYVPPEESKPQTTNTDSRKQIQNSLELYQKISLSKDRKTSVAPGKTLNYVETLFPIKSFNDQNPILTLNSVKKISSAIPLARSIFFKAGAIDDFFKDEYVDSDALSKLFSTVKKKTAEIKFSTKNLPSLLPGDCIIASTPKDEIITYVIIKPTTIEFGKSYDCIIGGLIDGENKPYMTLVLKSSFTLKNSGNKIVIDDDFNKNNKILKIINAEIMGSN